MIQKSNAAELGPVDVSGFVGVETRIFTQNPKHVDQDNGAEVSVIFNPEFRYKTEDRKHQLAFIPFYRQDSRDHERSHLDVREAYWLWLNDNVEVLTGINKVFWGVAESRHLVNIINQTDAIEDIDGEDYLGQPMINIARQNSWGRVDAYILPGFRKRTFPGPDGRFRGALPVDTDNAQYESGAEEKHIDFAARYSHYFGDWDVGLSYFYGTGREPLLLPNTTATRLVPHYDIINQVGFDLQYTNEAWLWKFEGIVRKGQGNTFSAAVGGFEYSFYQVFESNADIGILAEYQYDGRHANSPPTTADGDIFNGVRLALNDIQDTSVLAGVSFDPSTHETFYNFEADRRIGDNYTIELRARFLSGADYGEASFPVERDDYIQIRLARYF